MRSYLVIALCVATALAVPVPLPGKNPNCAKGRQGQVLVELFSWRWNDVAKECENVLGPKGFCGVQVSPPNEHRIITTPNRPWYERYQPVSYKLTTQSGSREQFVQMVKRCKAAGVQVYADAVINHMAPVDAGTGRGSAGSYYDTQKRKFTGVPYTQDDFNDRRCTTSSGNIEDYSNAQQVRFCRLKGLLDLAGSKESVRGKISAYLTDMLNIGIDGYRIDAAKHMLPMDLQAILKQAQQTKPGKTPFVLQQVVNLDKTEPIQPTDYTHLGRVTEFNYGQKMKQVFKTGTRKLSTLKNIDQLMGLQSRDAVVFLDNHDNQRGTNQGVLTFKDSRPYKMAAIFMLAHPYGLPRLMSSYRFQDDSQGPPTGTPGQTGTCRNGWVCEHRWRQIVNMVQFRNLAGQSPIQNFYTNGNNQIAFSRGQTSFIAMNKDDGLMDLKLKTGLPSGLYCDIISGSLLNGKCTGRTIKVDSDTTTHIRLDGSSDTPVIAIHKESRVGDHSGSQNLKRTIIFIKKQTQYGESLFLRGGLLGGYHIPISYPPPREHHTFQAYNAWSQGDLHIDWSGAEINQGTYKGQKAQGSPMAWTTSDQSAGNHVPENTYGEHYWMLDVMMDCSQMQDGYFELKGYINGQYENKISQTRCQGQPSYAPQSNNHVAKCGYKNVFTFNQSECIMEKLYM